MALQFAVLASGSRGNAALVRADGPGLLIDVGIGPRSIQDRLHRVGASWDEVASVLLTHTHRDHVGPASLRWLARRRLGLYCHAGHEPFLARFTGFQQLQRLGLVRLYDERPFLTSTGLRVEPIELSHDAGPTFGFRVEARTDRRAGPVSVGFVADTGCWSSSIADALADVDLLGVEFNHDEALQLGSGRPPALIDRNLGAFGHLSNTQGAGLIAAVLERSRPGKPRHVVLLHLSQECNRAELALRVARTAAQARRRRVFVHAAEQDAATPNLVLHPRRAPSRGARLARFPWEAA